MGLWLPPSIPGQYLGSNLTAADRDGTTVTSGGSAHAKGSWASLIDPLPDDVGAIAVRITGVAVTATVTSYLVDIGAGPTGGGSEYVVLQDLNAWGAGTVASQLHWPVYWFPVFIPKGERLSARSQALAVSDTANVAVTCYGANSGWASELPTMWERLGTVTNSNGVSVTPASGSFGSWTTILDPITKDYKWWHVGMDGLADTSLVVMDTVLELGIGETSAAVTTIGQWTFRVEGTESIGGPYPATPVYQPLPADTVNGVFIRTAAGGTEARGHFVYAAQ